MEIIEQLVYTIINAALVSICLRLFVMQRRMSTTVDRMALSLARSEHAHAMDIAVFYRGLKKTEAIQYVRDHVPDESSQALSMAMRAEAYNKYLSSLHDSISPRQS